jgi:RHS repeat-associated protein
VAWRVDSSASAALQNVWGLMYIDGLVLRDRDTDGNGTLDERRYCLQDGNWNAVALVDTSGDVTQRFCYQPFGTCEFLDASYTTNTNTSQWTTLFTGRELDRESELYYFRARYLNCRIGVFVSRDQVETVDGNSMFATYFVPNGTDPSGFLVVRQIRSNLSEHCPKPNASVQWRFETSPKVTCRFPLAFFVQHVRVHCMICDCNTKSKKPCHSEDLEYWEAWPVVARGKNKPASVVDTASFYSTGPRGSYRQSGEIRFYCVAPPNQAPVEGEITQDEIRVLPTGTINPGPCVTSSGVLARTQTSPSFWERPPADGPERRLFRMYWNCCCGRQASASARP